MHSLGIGVATQLAASGVVAFTVLQKEERWRSDAFEVYVKLIGKTASGALAAVEVDGTRKPGLEAVTEKMQIRPVFRVLCMFTRVGIALWGRRVVESRRWWGATGSIVGAAGVGGWAKWGICFNHALAGLRRMYFPYCNRPLRFCPVCSRRGL